MNTYRFYKTIEDRWYIDLPDWPGTIADLEMVAGADIMLALFAEGGREVKLVISTEPFNGADSIKFVREATEFENGAFYFMKSCLGLEVEVEMWLCDVTKWVFNGIFPETIYMKPIRL